MFIMAAYVSPQQREQAMVEVLTKRGSFPHFLMACNSAFYWQQASKGELIYLPFFVCGFEPLSLFPGNQLQSFADPSFSRVSLSKWHVSF